MTGAKIDRKERPQIVLVARACVLREDGKMLIVKRSPGDANNAGKWEWPGGKVERGQQLVQALQMEIDQETGLIVSVTHPVIDYISFIIDKGKYQGLLYLALISVARLEGGQLRLSDEHTEYAWVTYRQMFGYNLTLETKQAAVVAKKHKYIK